MLIQLEMYEGIIIFATNLRENYDKAFESRFLYEIEFALPDDDCRRLLIDNYIVKLPPLKNANYSESDISEIVNATRGLSGREIKNSILKALNRFAFDISNSSYSEEEPSNMPLDILLTCFSEKVICNEIGNIKVKKGSEETKQAIGKELLSKATRERKQEEGNWLLQLAYIAAWIDGCLSLNGNNELSKLQALYPDSKHNEKAGSEELASILQHIKDLEIEKTAVIFTGKVLYADGAISPSGNNLLKEICQALSMPDDYLARVIEYVKADYNANIIYHNL